MTRSQENGQDGRARQGQANRERIYRAAVKLFVGHGYDSATMEEIAAEAGVTRRTAFNHFPAKGDIAVEWAVRRGGAASAIAREAARADRPVPDRIRAYFHELAVLTERDWRETRQLMTGLQRGYGAPGHRSWIAGELRTWITEWAADDTTPGPPLGAAGTELFTDVLYDVFQGALLRRLPLPGPPEGGFTTEVDAAIGLVLSASGHGAAAG